MVSELICKSKKVKDNMSHKDYILNLLNITDNNIIFNNIIEKKVTKNIFIIHLYMI